MNNLEQPSLESNYDLVGKYEQDQINGFSQETITDLLDAAELDSATDVLDAMGGDGNLIAQVTDYCKNQLRCSAPNQTLLEFSRVQCEFARERFGKRPIDIIWGDILTRRNRRSNQALPKQTFDRVMVKSANHEIPSEKQLLMYENIASLLRPGGLFVNLGFLFDNENERDEFIRIANSKDSLAGMHSLVENRYFLLRDEYYELLRKAGFTDIRAAKQVQYHIASDVVSEQYFPEDVRDEHHFQFQATQALSRHLRKSGRIEFNNERSLMRIPGEITIARLPSSAKATYEEYPYELIENIQVYKELVEKVSAWVQKDDAVLDLGSGPGLFAKSVLSKAKTYHGVDISPEFVKACRQNIESHPAAECHLGDLNTFEPPAETYDAAVLMNVLYHEGVEAVSVLRRALAALRTGGRLIVSGPLSANSFINAEPLMRQQLTRDGWLPKHEATFVQICEANRRLLSSHGNYWSAEGMAELLLSLGARKVLHLDTSHYYGSAYQVVAEK